MQNNLIILRPVPDPVEKRLRALFRVHNLWSAQNPEKFLSDIAPGTRFLAVGSDAPSDFKIDRSFLSSLPKLEIVASYGVGVDHIDLGATEELGIVVTNTPGGVDEEVADFAIGLLISTVREIPLANEFLRSGRWESGAYPLARGTLRNRRVGIAGLGAIGHAIARRVTAFGLPVCYFGRGPKNGVTYPYYECLFEMAEAVDTLILSLPGGNETRNLVDANVLEALGPGGVLINVGRGSVVDERALIEALKSGRMLAAGLDVFSGEPSLNPELLQLRNAVLTPHIASASVSTRLSMWDQLVDNLEAWRNSRVPVTPVKACASIGF